MKHHITIDDETMTVLRASSVSATSVKLPPGQLTGTMAECEERRSQSNYPHTLKIAAQLPEAQ